jgi:hypothetical protein
LINDSIRVFGQFAFQCIRFGAGSGAGFGAAGDGVFTLTMPRMVLTTSVASASPSTSSATINSGLPALATPSRIGSRSRTLEIFLSCSRM